MVRVSTWAVVADLLGEDPRCPASAGDPRPPLAEVRESIRKGEVLPACDDGSPVAVYATDEGVFAVADACPHDGGPLSSGFVEAGKLVCARHGWEFDGTTGACPRRRARICPRRL